jgi:hypothetical protein
MARFSDTAKTTGVWIGMVLAIDALLLILFVRWAYVEHHHITDSIFYGQQRFSSVDGSLMESWGYIKEASIICLAVYAFKKTKEFFYAAYAVLFASVLADDSLRLHEAISVWLSSPSLLGKYSDIPAAFLVSGVPLALAALGFFRLSSGRKMPGFMLLGGFGLMAFFAVVVDNLHELLIGSEHFQTASSFVEDGGELVSLTVILAVWRAYAWSIGPHKRVARPQAAVAGRRTASE